MSLAQHLALKKALGHTESDQASFRNIDGVQPYQAIDKRLTRPPRIVGRIRKLQRNLIAQYEPMPALHQNENHTQHGGILANDKRLELLENAAAPYRACDIYAPCRGLSEQQALEGLVSARTRVRQPAANM